MPAKGDGITKRDDGRYMGRYTVQTPTGPKRRTIYGKRYREVENRLIEARGNAARGIVYDDENLTVEEYMGRWLRDAVWGTVRESTYYRDECLIRTHVVPQLGRTRLKNLTAMELQSFYRERLERGISESKGLSGSTVLKIHQILHKALGRAVRWNLVPRNPADDVQVPRATKKEMRPLSQDEAKRFLKTARESGDGLEALYDLAIRTGMRRGELLGLKWNDIDFDASTIRVVRTLSRTDNGRTLVLADTKSEKGRRTVRLNPRAVDALRRHRTRQAGEKLVAGGNYNDIGMVFAGSGGYFINPSNLRQRSYIPLLERAGLGGKGITFHDLRHTCASILFQKNVHPKHVQELLGHARVSITLDTYSHMLPGMGGEAAAAMEEALG